MLAPDLCFGVNGTTSAAAASEPSSVQATGSFTTPTRSEFIPGATRPSSDPMPENLIVEELPPCTFDLPPTVHPTPFGTALHAQSRYRDLLRSLSEGRGCRIAPWGQKQASRSRASGETNSPSSGPMKTTMGAWSPRVGNTFGARLAQLLVVLWKRDPPPHLLDAGWSKIGVPERAIGEEPLFANTHKFSQTFKICKTVLNYL
ncbi:hypothetical protein VNO77_03072 [Canavalia gladiata]|uniref:Uncharacterized protein n=1 Tax=Canavalia gladiata TaxID=3824 RepID=A0AAN9MW48_CANGL